MGKERVAVIRLVLLAAAVLSQASQAFAQEYSESVEGQYRISRDVVYVTTGSWEGRLDVYHRSDADAPLPTLVWIHGGSSTGGSKDGAIFSLLPYLEQGWNVVNVEHRLAGVTLAPAALQNVHCALRWVRENATEFGFDDARIVISGASSGGWFAVAAAMAPKPEGLDELCPGPNRPPVAAVVNWYGNWDLADVLEGPNAKGYASGWVRGLPDPMGVAESLSPLPIREGQAPPVISVHGDADAVVPYSQSIRLHEALEAAGIPQVLVTIPGGRHGGFTRSENQSAFEAIWTFLEQQGNAPP